MLWIATYYRIKTINIVFTLVAWYFIITPARAQTFEQTAAFIVLGGDVDLSEMTFNSDGSVSTPSSSVGLAVTPGATWTSISSAEGCVAQSFGPSLQTNGQVAIQVHFNHIVGYQSGEHKGQRGVVWLVGEEPVFCVQSLPKNSLAPTTIFNSRCANKVDIAVNDMNNERVGKALVHLFSKYCHKAVRKNAF